MQRASADILQKLLQRLAVVRSATDGVENREIAQRLNISLNNIRSSLCYQTGLKMAEHEQWVGI